MWDLIVSVPDHCLSFYFGRNLVINSYYTKAKKHMCVSGFSSGKTRYGRSALSLYFVKIFYIKIAFFNTFSPIFQQI